MKLIKDLGLRQEKNQKRRWGLFFCPFCERTVEKRTAQGNIHKSCGCATHLKARTKHGDSFTRLYQIWADMKTRCNNNHNSRFHRYGGRGITYAKEWNSYEVFKCWAINSGYRDNLTIDRIENCRWVTIQENIKNRPSQKGQCKNGNRSSIQTA